MLLLTVLVTEPRPSPWSGRRIPMMTRDITRERQSLLRIVSEECVKNTVDAVDGRIKGSNVAAVSNTTASNIPMHQTHSTRM